MKVEIRFSTREELSRVPSKSSRRGLSLLVDGALAAIAIFHFDPAMSYATLDVFRALSPFTLHRFGRAAHAIATQLSGGRYLACADRGIPRAGAWLERLGFEQKGEVAQGLVYMSKGGR